MQQKLFVCAQIVHGVAFITRWNDFVPLLNNLFFVSLYFIRKSSSSFIPINSIIHFSTWLSFFINLLQMFVSKSHLIHPKTVAFEHLKIPYASPIDLISLAPHYLIHHYLKRLSLTPKVITVHLFSHHQMFVLRLSSLLLAHLFSVDQL